MVCPVHLPGGFRFGPFSIPQKPCLTYSLDLAGLDNYTMSSSTTTLNEKVNETQVTDKSVPQTPVSPEDGPPKEASTLVAPIDLERQPQPDPSAAYHIFNRSKKLQIVYIVSAAAIFSPLSSNIYFPALGMISKVG